MMESPIDIIANPPAMESPFVFDLLGRSGSIVLCVSPDISYDGATDEVWKAPGIAVRVCGRTSAGNLVHATNKSRNG